ncbi:unnamed protein product [Aphanomyces euteiches]|nr:hypothetical protein AeRB84_004424 [Aphanomyces euteiches]
MSLKEESKSPSYLSIAVPEEPATQKPKEDEEESLQDICGQILGIPMQILKGFWGTMLALIVLAVALVIMIVNTLFWLIVIAIATPLQLREWLGWKHELISFWYLFDTDFHAAEFYRATAKRFDALLTAESSRLDKIVNALVKAQFEAVAQLIDGGKAFIDQKDTMALSSVAVSAMFYVAFIVYIWQQSFDIASVNSKVFDALAIILPLLLQEELTVALSQVFLWGKWFTANLDIGAILTSWIPNDLAEEEEKQLNEDGTPKLSDEEIERAKEVLRKYKLKFDNRVNKMCYSIGVGAVDMFGPATFISSLWTLFFLIQGYIVESYEKADNSNHVFKSIDDEKRAMNFVYWFLVYYSGALVLFCFLPFFSRSSEEQKEDFESVASSCETYLFIQHMTNLQDRTMAVMTTDGTTDTARAYPIIRRLRQQAIHQLSTDDVIAYAFYVLALSTYDYFTGEVDGTALDDLKDVSDDDTKTYTKLTPIVPEESYFWNAALGDVVEGGKVDDALPTFLLQVPSDNEEKKQSQPKEMTLFSIPMMGVHMFENVLTERKVTDMSSIYENQLIQDKKVYLCQDEAHADLVCIGLEVKIMEAYNVSIYIVAEEGGPIWSGFGVRVGDVTAV